MRQSLENGQRKTTELWVFTGIVGQNTRIFRYLGRFDQYRRKPSWTRIVGLDCALAACRRTILESLPASRFPVAMIEVREENLEDFDPVRDLTIEAFGSSPLGHNGEANLIECLRLSCQERLSLVACTNSQALIGHILFTPAVLETADRVFNGMGLGPVSVLPEYQGIGVGTKLVTEGLKRLFGAGYDFIAVIGHPEFYLRFGFLPAENLGILHGFEGISQKVFFVLLNPKALPVPLRAGRVYYAPGFGAQHESRQKS